MNQDVDICIWTYYITFSEHSWFHKKSVLKIGQELAKFRTIFYIGSIVKKFHEKNGCNQNIKRNFTERTWAESGKIEYSLKTASQSCVKS